MKNFTFLLLVCVSLITTKFAQAQTTSTILTSTNTGNNEELVSPQRVILNNNQNFIELEYRIENMIVNDKNVNGNDYQYINVKDFDFMDQ
ncbi:hypothetical protein OAK19_02660, partial [Aureispira]|nr:hypothetical protein [Aureispira sp.]